MKTQALQEKWMSLGRVVIPAELRRTLGIVEGTALNFHVDGENIVLRKYAKVMLCYG